MWVDLITQCRIHQGDASCVQLPVERRRGVGKGTVEIAHPAAQGETLELAVEKAIFAPHRSLVTRHACHLTAFYQRSGRILGYPGVSVGIGRRHVEVGADVAVDLDFHALGATFTDLAIAVGGGIEVGIVLLAQVIHRHGHRRIPADRFVLNAHFILAAGDRFQRRAGVGDLLHGDKRGGIADIRRKAVVELVHHPALVSEFTIL